MKKNRKPQNRKNQRKKKLKQKQKKKTKKKYKKKNIKSNKGETTNNIQINPNKDIGWFFSRKSASQKGVTRYIWGDEGKEFRTKNILHSNAPIQIW